jgi:hypothetical protein
VILKNLGVALVARVESSGLRVATMPAPLVGPNSLRPLAGLAQDEPGARGGAARGGRGLGSVSRRSEVLPYSGKQIGGGDRCKCDKERRNQVIDHNTNDSTAG